MGWHWGILASSGGAAGAFDLLETTVLSSSAATVTFSNLNTYTDYKHLQLRVVAKNNNANTSLSNAFIQFNSDTANNYVQHYLSGNGSSVSSVANTSLNGIYVSNWIPGNTTSNNFGALVLDLLDFSNTSKNKTARSLAGGYDSSETVIGLYSGAWLSTSAITSMLIDSQTGDFQIGSRFSLYGVK